MKLGMHIHSTKVNKGMRALEDNASVAALAKITVPGVKAGRCATGSLSGDIWIENIRTQVSSFL